MKRKFQKQVQPSLRKGLDHLPGMHRHKKSSAGEGILFLSLGLLAGMAAGMLVAQKYGGFGALTDRIRNRIDEKFGRAGDQDEHGYEDDDDDFDAEDDDLGDLSPMEELEERVLEAYRNDPVLCERAIDIGALDTGIVELTGWVHEPDEATHAVTIARGTPGVETVVNRLAVRDEDDRYDEFATRYDEGYDSQTESHWNGQQVGMGRRRQGKSDDPGRHADPKVDLEDKWLDTDQALESPADDLPGAPPRGD